MPLADGWRLLPKAHTGRCQVIDSILLDTRLSEFLLGAVLTMLSCCVVGVCWLLVAAWRKDQ